LPFLPLNKSPLKSLNVPELEHIAGVELGLDFLVHPVDEQLVVEVRLLNHPRREVDRHCVPHSRPISFEKDTQFLKRVEILNGLLERF
jgi:hypothetical protein